MRKTQYCTNDLKDVFSREKILTLDAVKRVLGTSARRTAFRKLDLLQSRSSYSHAGQYYTLDDIAEYDAYGLWAFNKVCFSKFGSLVTTLEHLISVSHKGYLASELKLLLQVRVHNALTGLYLSGGVKREKIGKEYLYVSPTKGSLQRESRKQAIQQETLTKSEIGVDGLFFSELTDYLRTFLSILNEKQKRIFLGFESLKHGHGGDVLMEKLSGVNVKTIAKGRCELKSKNITPDRVRQAGAGRCSIKKN